MISNVAPLTFQERVDVPPAEMLPGDAVKDRIIGGTPSAEVFTVIVTSAFCVPKVLTAERV